MTHVSASELGPVWRDGAFLRYLTARSFSGAGAIITLIALPIMAYRITSSPTVTAVVAACEAAPYLLFGLVAGAVTDRSNRKLAMVSADTLGGLIVASLPIAHLCGRITLSHIMLVAFCAPAMGVFFDGAAFGALPTLVGKGRIAEANSVAVGVQSVIEIAVPSLVGVGLAFVHPSTLMIFDALSYFASAALIASITRPLYDVNRVVAPFSARQLGREISEGLGFLWRHRGVRAMTTVATLQCMVGGAFVALMVVWADRQLGVGTQGWRFGLVYASWAIGGVIASFALPSLLRRHSPPWVALRMLPVSAILGLIVPLLDRWWLAALMLSTWASVYIMVFINSVSYRQEVTPESLLGRVNTTGRMIAWGIGWTGGALSAGVLVSFLGLRGTMLSFASISILSTVVAWSSPLRHSAPQPVRVAY